MLHAAPGFSGLLEKQAKAFRIELGCQLKEKPPTIALQEAIFPQRCLAVPTHSPGDELGCKNPGTNGWSSVMLEDLQEGYFQTPS